MGFLTKKQKKEKIGAIVDVLKSIYPVALCSLEYEGEGWKLLVMGRLSAQCTDERVNIVCRDLFKEYPSAQALADAPLEETLKAKSVSDSIACEDCDVCIKACPANALRSANMTEITLNGKNYRWIPADGKACDWSKKYALCGEEGHKYTGSDSNFKVPDEITEENLTDAMKKADRILSYRPTTVHRCVIECPLVQR